MWSAIHLENVEAVSSPTSVQEHHPDDRDRAIVRMLAAGHKDAAISRALGVTQRTVIRRIADLMHALGVETRFQAGVEAARKGWL